jgi:type VI secretion system protein ImpJ
MATQGEVRWTEGMFLRPQHFQQSDLFSGVQRRQLARLLHPFPWGVRHLEIDIDALETEILRVQRCEVVFPDGLVFRYPEASELRDRSFLESFAATLEGIGVYLAIPALEQQDAGAQRFASRRDHCRDLYDPSSTTAVDYVIPRAELIFTNNAQDERLAGCEAVQIAEVRRTGRAAPRYELSRRHIAPALRSDASPLLMSMARQVHDQVCAAARNLGMHRRGRGEEGLASGAGDLEQLVALLALNQFAAALHHLLAHGGGHPIELFQLLAEVRGALTTFSATEESFNFRDYVHTDLYNSFAPLVESIRKLLEQLIPSHYEAIPLDRQGAKFTAAIPKPLFDEGTAFLLALRGFGPLDEFKKTMDSVAKLSSAGDIGELATFRLKGIPRQYREVPPAEIPRNTEFAYFAIETTDKRWEDKVRKEGTLCLYLEDAPPELNATLYVALRRAKQR